MAAPATAAFDPARPYRLHPRAAVRPEPFGALVYHYGNRRLVFLRAPELVEVVTSLADQPSATAAIRAAGVTGGREASFESALASLERSGVIEPRTTAP